MDILGRYRNLIVLVGVLFLQALGLAVQVKRAGTDAQDTRLIRIWAVGAVTPFERVLIWAENSTGNLWHNYFYLRGVRAENRQLKEQIEQMRLEQVRLSEDAAQAHRLQNLLGFKEQFVAKTVAAQVIGTSGSDLSRVVYIDKGSDAGIKPDMAVITADGIVGKVWDVFPSVAKVLLIDDQSSGVGVILEKSRLQGVLRGTASGEVVLERVMSDEQVPVGESVLTSGGDQIFPKGLPAGTITKVGTGKDLFLNIHVRTAVDLSKLEEVLVVVQKQERQAVAEDSAHERASDILAQRLPSVPDKPADAKADAKSGDAATAKPAGAAAKPSEGSNVAGSHPSNPAMGGAASASGATDHKPPPTTAKPLASAASTNSQAQPQNVSLTPARSKAVTVPAADGTQPPAKTKTTAKPANSQSDPQAPPDDTPH
jgi:rod shape-determining protein MreC